MEITVHTPKSVVAQQPLSEILGYIIASAARAASHRLPDHTIEEIMDFMTSDVVLHHVSRSYMIRTRQGASATDVMTSLGMGLVTAYCKRYQG